MSDKLQEATMKALIENKKIYTKQDLDQLKNTLDEDEFKKVIGSCLLLFTDVFTSEEVEEANEGKPLNKEKVLTNADKLIGLDYNDIQNQIYRMTGKKIQEDK